MFSENVKKRNVIFPLLCLTIAFLINIGCSDQAVSPAPNRHFYGDADGILSSEPFGPHEITQEDVNIHLDYISGTAIPDDYNTLQPKALSQYWNTCDLNGDRDCTNLDTDIMADAISSIPANVGWKANSWVIDLVDSPLCEFPASALIPFYLNLSAESLSFGVSGRPGISIVTEIDSGVGALTGRVCNPLPTPRDQAPLPGAQCALGVTISDWNKFPDAAITEVGEFGLKIISDGPGALQITARVEANPLLDIPAVTFSPTIFFANTPCLDTEDNDGDTLVDADDPGCSSAADISETQWDELSIQSASCGGISKNPDTSRWPRLKLHEGTPTVVWWDLSNSVDDDKNWEIYIRRFNGSYWEDIGAGSSTGGGISDNSGQSAAPKLALHPITGDPVVVWQDSTTGIVQIYIKRFDGNDWVEIPPGSGSATGGGISNSTGSGFWRAPNIALDSGGNPYVVWQDNSSDNHEIYIKHFNGTSWVEVGAGSFTGGGISDNGGRSETPDIAIDSTGKIIVAWFDDSDTEGDKEIYIKRFDGSDWVEIPPGSGSASGGGISDNTGESSMPSLALDNLNNPFVAWEDKDNTLDISEIYIKRFDGSDWVEIPPGSGSASGGGISNIGVWSGRPSLALDNLNNPFVAWGKKTSVGTSDGEIYGKTFDDVNMVWVEGDGSATWGGISDNIGNSWVPVLALDGNNIPFLTWQDTTFGDVREVYVKRWARLP